MNETTHNGPLVGCGAAIIDGSRILLVKRRRHPEAGHWGLPGGKVEWLERVEHAVVREIEEELGVELALKRLLCVVDQIDAKADEHWIAPVYLAEISGGRPTIREPDALAEVSWFELASLPAPLTEATRQALASFHKTGRFP